MVWEIQLTQQELKTSSTWFKPFTRVSLFILYRSLKMEALMMNVRLDLYVSLFTSEGKGLKEMISGAVLVIKVKKGVSRSNGYQSLQKV